MNTANKSGSKTRHIQKLRPFWPTAALRRDGERQALHHRADGHRREDFRLGSARHRGAARSHHRLGRRLAGACLPRHRRGALLHREEGRRLGWGGGRQVGRRPRAALDRISRGRLDPNVARPVCRRPLKAFIRGARAGRPRRGDASRRQSSLPRRLSTSAATSCAKRRPPHGLWTSSRARPRTGSSPPPSRPWRRRAK